MELRQLLLQKLPGYQNKKVLLKDDQTTRDIIKNIICNHNLHKKDYDKISNYFWKGNIENTTRYIFDFLKENVKYDIEPDHTQTVKSPAAILATGIYQDGNNDCKHYASFIGGILDSLKRSGKNIDWKYRFANYKFYTKDPGHVFVVVNDQGKEIWVDPVLSSYNKKQPYISAIDKKINDMSLYSISGIEEPGQISGRGFAKIALAASRNAVLALIGLNVHKMATKMYQSLQDPAKYAKMKAKWEKKGGNFQKLLNTIYKGSKHPELIHKKPKRGLFGRRRRRLGDMEMGSDEMGVAIVALLAAAVPVLVALKEFFPKSKVINDAETAIKDVSAAGGINAPGVQIPNEAGQLPPPTREPIAPNEEGNSGNLKQYLPYAAVGLAAVLLLTSKSN